MATGWIFAVLSLISTHGKNYDIKYLKPSSLSLLKDRSDDNQIHWSK